MPGKHRMQQRRTQHCTRRTAIAVAVGIALCAVGRDAATATPAPSPPPGGSAASAPDLDLADSVDQVVQLVNVARAGHGCAPVRPNAVLQQAAQRHADDMAARRFFDHTNPDGTDPGKRITSAGYSWSAYGENIAVGWPNPSAVMKAWMNSPGHRANILDCGLADIGVGVRSGTGGPWWTQDLASRG
ncbi:CAP domain-containing protein [Streptomyces sp. NPDC048506]|uniref:CAP domain-containing protein n=1 Tax=Streptomyces sp. NPDC048506 TaxID=3155028 RepID=UPI00344601BD